MQPSLDKSSEAEGYEVMAKKGKAVCYSCGQYREGTMVTMWIDNKLHVICPGCKEYANARK